MSGNYRLDKIRVGKSVGERPAIWTFAREPVSGTEYSYAVVDENFRARNEWDFVVRVPRSKSERIEVRPLKVPNVNSWAGLERRSLTFNRATRSGYRGSVYCPVALADPTGEKSRTLVTDKGDLPRWFQQLGGRVRKKTTIASTRGTDSESLVLHCDPDDHQFMIRAFFATKVWVMSDSAR